MLVECEFDIKRVGLEVSDVGWELWLPKHIEAWTEGVIHLSTAIYKLPHEVVVKADWRPLLDGHKHLFDFQQELAQVEEASAEFYSILEKFHDHQVRIRISAETEHSEFRDLYTVVANYICDVFCIMNLSSPGSCDFFLGNLMEKSRFGTPPHQISLSSHNFECAIIDSSQGKWPKIGYNRVAQTSLWYYSNRQGISQVSRTKMESVIFALMHLCKDGISPTSVIWIFYALEQLFGTRVGENKSGLERRLVLLLSPNEKQSKILRKNLDKLFSFRNKLVHGGLEIVHVLGHDVVDEKVGDAEGAIMELTEFGFNLLVASLQKLISEQWGSLNFREVIEPDKISVTEMETSLGHWIAEV